MLSWTIAGLGLSVIAEGISLLLSSMRRAEKIAPPSVALTIGRIFERQPDAGSCRTRSPAPARYSPVQPIMRAVESPRA